MSGHLSKGMKACMYQSYVSLNRFCVTVKAVSQAPLNVYKINDSIWLLFIWVEKQELACSLNLYITGSQANQK